MTPNERVKSIREKTGLSQAKFAYKLGIPSGIINNIELNKGRVTPEVAKKIEETFNINLRWTLYGEETEIIKENQNVPIPESSRSKNDEVNQN